LNNGDNYSGTLQPTSSDEELEMYVPSGATATFSGKVESYIGFLYINHFHITKTGGGTLVFIGLANVRNIHIDDGILQMGNGIQNPGLWYSGGWFESVSYETYFHIKNGCLFRLHPAGSSSPLYNTDGAGNVEIIGDGELIINPDDWNHTGETTINGGELSLHIDATSINKNYVNNGSLIFNLQGNWSKTVTYWGTITGTGHVHKLGMATLRIPSVQGYSGVTLVAQGTLQVGPFGLGLSFALSLESSNSMLTFEGNNINFLSPIAGDGEVLISEGQNVTISSWCSYKGKTTIGHDALLVISGPPSFAGIGNIENRGTLYFNSNYYYRGIISGSGEVIIGNTSVVAFEGVNTYTGRTYITGTLQLGSFFNLPGSIDGTSDVIVNANSRLIFYNGSANKTFSKVISGAGNVEKHGSGNLYFDKDQSYSGTTTIEDGALYLGKGGATGSVAGNIINKGTLNFNRTTPYTYSGVISGTGTVATTYENTGTITLNGAKTYTGKTLIYGGTLALGNTGTIEASEKVQLSSNSITFSISNPKTIKALCTSNISVLTATVNLGATLNIGFAGQDNGYGNYTSKFTGTGGINKRGTGVFTITSNANTATGSFEVSEGKLILDGAKWAGNLNRTGGILDIRKNVTISGALSLNSGDIYMNLTSVPPSKITATGAVSTSGTNTLYVTSGGIFTPQTIIAGASGIPNPPTPPYTAITHGRTTTLSTLNNKELQIEVSLLDHISPTPGEGLTLKASSGGFAWKKGTDDVTTQDNLIYSLYKSQFNDITTVAQCEANGVCILDNVQPRQQDYGIPYDDGDGLRVFWVDINYLCVGNGLQPGTSFYVNVVVKDESNNKAAYTPLLWSVNKADLKGNVSILGDAVFGQKLTVDVTGLFSAPEIPDMGELSYQWKRGNADIAGATNSTYTLVQADIDSTITVVVTAYYCNLSTFASTPVVVKATQAAPAKPTLQSVSDTRITLNPMAGCEYRVNGNEWQTSTTFNDLLPGTSYCFEAHKPETDTRYASPESEPATFTTDTTVLGIVSPTLSNQILVYPNPTTGELRIMNNEQLIMNNVEIYDVYGKRMEIPRFARNDGEAKFPSNSLEGWQPQADGVVLNISHLANGIYFLKIQTEKGAITRKVVKQ
jgi:autotransporter-associated beta strand protein